MNYLSKGFCVLLCTIVLGCNKKKGDGNNTSPTVSIPPPSYTVTTIAGSSTAGFANGTGTDATFDAPSYIVMDAEGNVYISDSNNNAIRKMTPAGVVSTFAGTGDPGLVNGKGTAAKFFAPQGLAIDSKGNLYVADSGNNCIRKITPKGYVTTFAGSGAAGAVDGTGADARLFIPYDVAIDATDNLFVADAGNRLIRKITADSVVTTFAGSSASGFVNGNGTLASFNNNIGIAVDAVGNIYVSDHDNHVIRKITTAGDVTTFAGTGTAGHTDGYLAEILLKSPTGIDVDAKGNVFFSESNGYVRELVTVDGEGIEKGKSFTLAGNESDGYSDGTGQNASFNSPVGTLVTADGTIYVADYGNNRIRKITLIK